MARKEWLAAAKEFEQATTLSPHDALIAWESALVYEQLARIVRSVPRDNILPDLASVPINAPDQPIDTVYCRDGGPRTCYVDLDEYTQPYAALPNGPVITADVLFMHPPSSVRLMKTIPVNASALVFLMGLDPGVRSWGSDGATFEVWLTTVPGSSRLIFHHTLEPEMAKRGWLPGMVDLAQWAGQTVTLELRITGGPTGNTASDWYAWGNVAFTQVEAARYQLELPHERMVQAWQALALDSSKMATYGDEALRLKLYADAVRWYERAVRLEQSPSFDLLYRRAAAAINSRHPFAEPYLAAAQALDPSVQVVDLSQQTTTRVHGSTLRWMTLIEATVTYGTPLSAHPGPKATAGYMWWPGQATAIVRAANTREYRVVPRVEGTARAAAELAIEIDGQQVAMVQLARGNALGEIPSLPIHLEAGLHTVNIRFVNNTGVTGEDQNAVIEEIIIEEH